MKRISEVYPQLSAAEQEAKLSPYRSIIDKYVLRFSALRNRTSLDEVFYRSVRFESRAAS
jgi:hypothetical protein